MTIWTAAVIIVLIIAVLYAWNRGFTSRAIAYAVGGALIALIVIWLVLTYLLHLA